MIKLDKRKLLGPLFAPLSRAKHSEISRMLVATAWIPNQLVRARYNKPYFAVDISSPKGLGAVISEAVLICNYAEKNKLMPYVISTNPLYTSESGKDFIELYLGAVTRDENRLRLKPLRFRTVWSLYHLNFDKHMPISIASKLFWKYFAPKPIITDLVNRILDNVPGRMFDLSIHYRGTDKALEAPLVQFDAYERAILNFQAKGGRLRYVFLATDNKDFESFIRAKFPELNFITYNLGSSKMDMSRGRHFSEMSPHDKAIESIINMFLLAASPICIRGASYMSAIAKLINPDMKTVTLNRTHWNSNGFPEQEILEEERLEADS
ncbi:hypothetical protein A1353_16500 [Methylomonas methanica]|uniref:Uncharacterized protein n=1 Tax=Methylomonas methanica TaxID=421 RepID=A0A177MBN9_METMH|nr:hypothetical protein [Methylomonas methanica]OAI02390.1 hypothetical protein A1353_16500 [Methylomonas methanica]